MPLDVTIQQTASGNASAHHRAEAGFRRLSLSVTSALVVAALAGAPADAFAQVVGSAGAAGADGGSNGDGGDGGAGGYGLQLNLGDWTLAPNATVDGGVGGAGGASQTGYGGSGGDGGIGVQFEGGGTLTNNATVSGGMGGAGGVGLTGSGASGRGGAAIVLGAGSTLINNNILAGAAGSTDALRGNAVEFTGSNSRLVLQDNAILQGNVISRSTGNVLEFKLANGDSSLDVSRIAATAPTAYENDAAKFFGFSKYEKTGDATLSLSGTTAAVTPWIIKGGTLSISSDGNLGATSGGLTLDGGTLSIATSYTTLSAARTINLGAAGGTFDTELYRVGYISGAVTGSGSLTKSGEGYLILIADNTFTGTTYVKGGTLRLGDLTDTGNLTGDLHVARAAVVELTRLGDYTYGGAIKGPGRVDAYVDGTLTLTGENVNWYGPDKGILRIYSGTVQIGNGGTTGSIDADVQMVKGSLVFNRADDSEYDGAISDYDPLVYVGTVTKLGTGTLSFTYENSYTGLTLVKAGTLQIGNGGLDGGRHGSIAGNVLVSAGATLAFNREDNVTFGQVISGEGSLDKRGIGQLTLTGTNTYTGGTRISNGSLFVGDGGTRGAIVGEVQIDQGSSLGFNRSDDVTFEGAISGAGGLLKLNTNTLALTGNNTFTGGIELAQGTLQIGDGASSGAIASDVRTNSGTTLVFNRRNASSSPSAPYDYAGTISGAGQVVVRSNTEVAFTGAATHTGGTVVESNAALALGNGGTTGSLDGDVTLQGGAFGFQRSNDYTYAGAITGDSTSRIVQAGDGTMSLTGDNSGFNGVVYITKGTLEINSALNGSAAVLNGTLAGTGQLAMAQIGAGGTLAPGSKTNPTGTLTANGPVQFANGSTLSIHALPDGSSSKLVVNGTTTVQDGARFQMVGLGNGLYTESTTYNVLQASGGVSGTFTTAGSSLAFLEPVLSYSADAVDLTVKFKEVPVEPGQSGAGGSETEGGDTGGGDTGGSTGGNTGNNAGSNAGSSTRPIRFADLALNRNQRSVAGALQSLPSTSPLYTRVLNLPEGTPATVFQSLAGETHASTSNTLNGVTSNVASLPMAQLRANMNAGMLPGRPTAQMGRGDASSLPQSAAQPVWAQVFGNWRTLRGTGDSAEVRQSDGGLFVGGDQAVGGGWRAGGALGYTGSHSSIKGQSSRADVDSYSGVIYGGKGFAAGSGKINLTLGMGYTWHDIETRRGVNGAGVVQQLKASYSANTTQFFTELGYALPVNERIVLEPFVGADFSDQRTRGFGEAGGDAALMGKSTHNQVGSSTLGLRAQTTFESGSAHGRLYATAGWRHSYGDLDPTTTMAFDGSQSFSVAGAPIARDAAVVSLGADIAVTRSTTVGVNYGGQFGGGNRQNSGAVNVRWRF
ncbi:autotransporter domain-containing protein [Bordetella sp. N]|uniref:autotransporter domain-containing protein n=1 Tax=Bordetella sp. N TaxID=1746199 RepID=UPI00070A507F|nr:autotransporter domain-containing protein [Bordetella sp. N]ALM83092.1 hypothetical protein ASB57_09130 [Bordetella sp. N]